MSVEIGALRIDLEADWAKLQTGLTGARNALGQFGGGVASIAGGVATAGLAIGAAAIAAVGAWALASEQMAENAQETRQAFDRAFGDSAAQANAWANNVAGGLRLSNVAIREQAQEFQNLFGAMGIAPGVAATTSEAFVQLANDFAALKNIRPEEAINLLRSALAGNTRTIRQYGIDLSDARVRTEALRDGIITTNQNLSEHQATLVRAALLTRDLASAHGQAAAQAGSARAEQERANMEFANASEELGTHLIPIVTAFRGFMADLLHNVITPMATGFANLIAGAGGFGQALAAIAQGPGAVAQALINGQAIAHARAQHATQTHTTAVVQQTHVTAQATTAAERHAQALLDEARRLNDATTRGRTHTSWLEQHRQELNRIVGTYNQVDEALRVYTHDIEIARRGGLNMDDAQRGLAQRFLDSVDSVKQLQEHLAELPAPLRALALEHIKKLTDSAGQANVAMQEFARTLNNDFGGKSQAEMQVNRLDEAFKQGLITFDVYKRALDEIDGLERDKNNTAQAAQDEARNARMQQFVQTLDQVALGTRSAADAAKQFIIEWLNAHEIVPLLEHIFSILNGGKNGAVKGGFDFGGLIGGLFNNGGSAPVDFGGKKALGGAVASGMGYIVGEKGPEWFFPQQSGRIDPGGASRGGGATVVNNYINTPDANSFYLSTRQLKRKTREALA